MGGEHLDRDAAGCSEESLGSELDMYYFLPEGKDLAAAAGLPSEGGGGGCLDAGAGSGGTGRISARRGGASRPGNSDHPTEVHGAAAEALG